jgi:UDP-N-acetylglucosamine 2-epimerase
MQIGNFHLVGNTMIDTLKACLGKLDADAARTTMSLPGRYIVATLHRPANVDDPPICRRVAALVGRRVRTPHRSHHRRVASQAELESTRKSFAAWKLDAGISVTTCSPNGTWLATGRQGGNVRLRDPLVS